MFPTPDLVNGFLRSDRLACVTCFKPLRHSRLGRDRDQLLEIPT
jgi:hypothetical protein